MTPARPEPGRPGTGQEAAYAVVIPTLGRPALRACLEALAHTAQNGPRPARVLLVDDRPETDREPLPTQSLRSLSDRVTVLTTGGSGPAAARNAGWREASEPWIAFLDDDVVVEADWAADLGAELAEIDDQVGGVQGRLRVPMPTNRRPTDWERTTAGLADSAWVTADMVYRADALARVGGFDERFRRAYREDADLALRILDDGWRLVRGRRRTTHPVRRTDRWASVRAQAGNADDALMSALHGPSWWVRAQAPRGRLPRHLAITAAGAGALLLAGLGRRRASLVAATGWFAGTAEFTLARIRPGPRTLEEVSTMTATSMVIPAAASWHWARGLLRSRRVTR